MGDGEASVPGGRRAMDIALMVEGQEGVTWPQWLALADAAERLGFEGLHTSDHYLSEVLPDGRGGLDAWGVICALAAVTSRIRLGTLVSPVTFRHPSVLAKLAVTADHVSGGRIDVAMGTGWYAAEHRAHGFPFPPVGQRMAMLEEQAEIVRRSWDDGAFSFAGAHHRIDGLDALPTPIQRPGPRLTIGGGGGPRSLALAARLADEYNAPDADERRIAELRAGLDAAWERAGRAPARARLSMMVPVVVAADRDHLARLEAQVAQSLAGGDGVPGSWIVGTPDVVVSRLRRLAALGVDRVLVEPTPNADLGMVELIGRTVLPALARDR